LNISVPRETATHASAAPDAAAPSRSTQHATRKASASIPLTYVADPKQRIETYRKLAGITDEEEITRLKAELRDRFGPLPAAVELLLQVAALKLLAAGRNITIIESKDDKLMLTRNNDFVQVGGKFPRLARKEPRARLNEIKRLLQMLR
jgi:transcription-repair coupling factor (superfamily II helicase)